MARSRLYRSRFLQENIRWKALDEIYKIYMLLHHSDLNMSANFRREFFRLARCADSRELSTANRAERVPPSSGLFGLFESDLARPATCVKTCTLAVE